jgi:hypothetical protein
MSDAEQALQRLAIAYWYDVDHRGGDGAPDFYVADGIFGLASRTFVGRDKIRAFYAWRKTAGERTTRHVVTNFMLIDAEEASASFTCIVSVFGAAGKPVLESKPPAMIADVAAACVRGDDGAWRFRAQIMKTIFSGGAALQIPSFD